MQQTCTDCSNAFEVDKEDLTLLEKLSPRIAGATFDIPIPTRCPPCRQRRRMSFRNERMLYQRKCDITGKNIVSVFSPDSPYTVCEKDHWYSDAFDPLAYGRDIAFDVPFFEQFHALALTVPLPSLRVEMSENCDFNNDMRACVHCYLCARTHESQKMLYTYRGNKSNECTDCMQVTKSQYLYECVECVGCYGSKYLFFCSECSDSAFLLDCRNCMSCFMCTNLRNKQYCFLDEQLTKKEYERKFAEFDFGSRALVEKAYALYAHMKKKSLRRALIIMKSEDSTGDNLLECKHCHQCFGVQSSQDCRYLWDTKLYKDSMDAYSGGRNSELIYETTSGSDSYGVQWCLRTSGCHDVRYSWFLTGCKDVFGSIGLRRARFCIFNKQYTEGDYAVLLPKIIDYMRHTGEWGEFFPPTLSPFAYNETVAQEYFPFDAKEAARMGYRWKKDNPKEYRKQTFRVPDHICDVKDEILKEVLACEQCGKNYKIVPQELLFYRAYGIAVPRHCVDCRHLRRLATKNPPILREDRCRKCGKNIVTTFPEATEMQIVCDVCYEKAVY